jgi:hypothetical protein
MNTRALTMFLGCVLSIPAAAASGIPLKAEPAGIQVEDPQPIRFFVLFGDMPVLDVPDMAYGAAGKVFQEHGRGNRTLVAVLAHRLAVTAKGKDRGVGLEATVNIRPLAAGKLKFVAEIWNDHGWARTTEPLEIAAYTQKDYKAMRRACAGDGCCLASVESMERNQGILANAEACPKGMSPNMLKCVSSYRWCEPR